MRNTVYKKERGVALLGVLLISALVLGLFAMTLTNVIVGNALVTTNQSSRVNVECAYGDLELAVFAASKVVAIDPALPNGFAVQPDTVAELAHGDPPTNPLANAVDGNGVPIDDVTVQPDYIITDVLPGGCAGRNTAVDIDYIYHRRQDEGAMLGGEAYHEGVVGMACQQGWEVYALNMLTTTPGRRSKVQSVYGACS